jgi:hypothetical protein
MVIIAILSRLRVIFLLGFWMPHEDYQRQVAADLSLFAAACPHLLIEYEHAISKLYILDLDPLKTLLAPRYSSTGRPSKNQAGIFRSLVLMNDLGCPLDQWIEKLSKNPVLQLACGLRGRLPGVASYYDFISRIINLDEKPRYKKKKRKPSKKLGKEKMPPRHPGIVQRLVDKILCGRRLGRRPERLLQEIFANVCVQPSIGLGLVPKSLSVSGDGTCIETGASPYGRKTCGCEDFLCECPRRFSDPNAAWGWDSHNERYFYGYTGYFISTYNRGEKLDLPLYLRIVDAKRHDSISAVVALAEFRDLYPGLGIDTFISDSASDNYATYELLHRWNINAVIALGKSNDGNRRFPAHLSVNGKGVPLCPGGHEMVNWGICDPKRPRLKWRCPRVLGKCGPCDACSVCSTSDYGRVIYTKPEWDLRLFTRVPRGSDRFRQAMKERTAAERVNNRILHHYGLEGSKSRGKKRISFFATIAAFNIHLDAQLAKLKSISAFCFESIFGLRSIA